MDAIIIGGGVNGLAAGIRLAQKGWQVRLYEANQTIGGSTRTEEVTLPGFRHDIGSAIHPFAKASPYLGQLPLEDFGLEWVQPSVPVAHPLDGGRAAAQYLSLAETADALGRDGAAWSRLMTPFLEHWDAIAAQFIGPLRIPRRPVLLSAFGAASVLPTTVLTRLLFKEEAAKALFAGLAAHSFLPMSGLASSGVGLVLGLLTHKVGWVFPKGGASAISEAMRGYFESLGGEVVLGQRITSMKDLPPARAYLFDLTPRQLLNIAWDDLSPRYRGALARYRYGPGVFKIDYATSEPIPWAAEEPRRAGTVHVGGTLAEIQQSELAAFKGRHSDRPFVLLAQHSLFDDTRAPDDKHTVWAYGHVPHGSDRDMSEIITDQIERFAPGFRDTILASHSKNTAAMQAWNANLIGGDIGGGLADLRQLFIRPALKWRPYRTSAKNIYLCSSSTPPGGGVHGMCGYWAAETAYHDHR